MPDLNKHARENYLKQPNLVEFLLAENLALKSLLYDKGILTPEEFKEHKERSQAILNEIIEQHIEAWKKAHPNEVSLYERSK